MTQSRLTEVTESVPSGRLSKIASEMSKELTKIRGGKETREFSFAAGSVAARAISDSRLAACSEEQFWRKIERYMASLGWGMPELHYAKIRQDGCEIFTVLVNTSTFTRERDNFGDTCDAIRGGIAEWLSERYHDRVTKSEETKCRTKGAEHCIFRFSVGESSVFSGIRKLFVPLV